ncbi:MAG: class I SAM-dependent methyltransferase [Byssovorax sp.]
MSIDSTPKATAYEGPNAEQRRNWNELSGPAWVAESEQIGAQIRAFGAPALARLQVAAGLRVLDVGCGGGETTLALAESVGPSGAVHGVDVSRPLLDHAREKAARAGVTNVTFELADAQTAALPEGAFDRLFSRFGVMFFADPVAAFVNLRKALKKDARMAFACWRSMDDNPWMKVPLAAVAKHVDLPRPEPFAPGPMAFADALRTRGILERAGFREVAFEVVDAPMNVGGGLADLDATVAFMTRIGPSAGALRQADPDARAAAIVAMREAVAPYHGSSGVVMPASVWIVTAVNG